MSSITAFTLQVKHLEAKIEKLESRPEKIARRARIERFETRLDKLLNNAPQDEFSISLGQPFPKDMPDFWRYTVDITDSPYDDSFTGGDPLRLNVRGVGKVSHSGGSSGFQPSFVFRQWRLLGRQREPDLNDWQHLVQR